VNPQREQFLNLKVTPARLTAEEAAWYLGFQAHEIPILVAKGLLKPLGRPPTTGVKYFATTVLAELHCEMADPRVRCHCRTLARQERPENECRRCIPGHEFDNYRIC
jgi:hypothetical protein